MASASETEPIDWPAKFLELDELVRKQPLLRQSINDAKIRASAAALAVRDAEAALEAARGAIAATMARHLNDHRLRIVTGRAVGRDTAHRFDSSRNFVADKSDLADTHVVVESSGSLAEQPQIQQYGFGLRVRVIGTTDDRYLIIPTQCELEIGEYFRE
jgi:hypothetical protein